jgi:membrane protease YdiL (CAAX protease family)
MEGNPSNWKSFAVRYRLRKLNKRDLVWLAGLLAFSAVTYIGLTFTAEWLSTRPGFVPPDFFPTELSPGGTGKLTPGEFMGFPLKGAWWVLVVYFFSWFFNIFGEESWFRGYILPRQELTHRHFAWIIHGILFTCFHFFWKWNLIVLLPGSLLLAYIVQRRKNTWIGILWHGFLNFLPMITILLGILGW